MNHKGDPDDHNFISHFRNKVSYTGYRNSLIEWTLSEDWLKIPVASKLFNGHKTLIDKRGFMCNSTAGEIPWRDMETK